MPSTCPGRKRLLWGLLGRETNGGEAAPGPGEDAGLGPIAARRIPQDHRPPSPGAAVMSWHREGAAGSRALEQVALARFLPPTGAPELGAGGDEIGVIAPPAAPSAALAADFTPPQLRWQRWGRPCPLPPSP